VGVTPAGLEQPPAYGLLHRSAAGAFGRSVAMRCPHYRPDTGTCGIWRYRQSACSTWFCKYVRGAVGHRFWTALRHLLEAVERSLVAHCVLELNPGVFEHRHLDGRDPGTYIAPLHRAIERWRAGWPAGYRTLRYRRGPGFLVIHDRRPGLERADYSFGEREAALYAACEDGATAAQACETLRTGGVTDLDVEDVEAFLDRLVGLRLVYEDSGRYLALALPVNLPEAAGSSAS
jgi:hypothetical protein